MTLVGLTESFVDGVATFRPDLAENLARGDENYLALLDAADAYIARNGLDLPEEPEARRRLPDPQCVTDPILELDLAEAGVGSIIWATGYAVDFGWLVDAFDRDGKPRHQRGVSSEPGVYFIGLPWLSRRGSSFIWGVWHDARHVADPSPSSAKYLAYRDAAQRQGTGPRLASSANQPPGSQLMPTHTRIRMFNTKDTYPQPVPGQRSPRPCAPATRCAMRGQVGTDFDGNLVGLGDPRAQAEQAMKNVKQLLEEAGSDLAHIVKTTTYLIDPRYREPVYREVGKWLRGCSRSPPDWCLALGQPQWLMEIDVSR